VFGTSEKSGTGIQFAGDRLRIVELFRSRKGSVLRAVVETGLERPFKLEELAEEERQEELAAALRIAGDEAGIDFVRPCVALDHRAFFFKSRPLIDPIGRSRRARAGNREHLLWEGVQFLGDDQEAFSVDCALAGGRGFVVAVRRQVLDCFLAIFERAGIDDLDFDIEPFALFNAAECAGLLAPDGVALLFEGWERGGQVMLVVDGVLQTVARSVRKGDDRRSPVEFAEDCIQRAREEGGCGDEAQQIWLAGVGMEELAEELMTRLGVACMPFPSFAGVDSSELPGLPAEEAIFAVAAGLAHRRCGA
jgi:hypothetical protein